MKKLPCSYLLHLVKLFEYHLPHQQGNGVYTVNTNTCAWRTRNDLFSSRGFSIPNLPNYRDGQIKVKIGNQLTEKLSGPQDVSAEDRIWGPSALQNCTLSSKVYFNWGHSLPSSKGAKCFQIISNHNCILTLKVFGSLSSTKYHVIFGFSVRF